MRTCVSALLLVMLLPCAAAFGADPSPPAVPPAAPPVAPPNPAITPPPAAAPTPAPVPSMKSLGHDRYQIGQIVIDKHAGKFSIPGRVLQLGVPLEYVAASPHGHKGYESLLEVDASGTEFNLACILLGLDASQSTASPAQFSRAPIDGPRVRLRLQWSEGSRQREVPLLEALYADSKAAKAAPDDWVYTGSVINRLTQRYAADDYGTLIGFVHDPNSIIDHRNGLGIGAYGSLSGNKALLPPVGSPVTLTVAVVESGKSGAKSAH